MRRLLVLLFLLISFSAPKLSWCEDNLLAVDVPSQTAKDAVESLPPALQTEKPAEPALSKQEDLSLEESPDQELEKMRSHREFIDERLKELEVIRLELEKSNLLLKKKEAQKQIYEIDKALPQDKNDGVSIGSGLTGKEKLVDPSDIKIKLLLISGNLKEGLLSLKGTPYAFKEGSFLASKLTVEKIEPDGVTFRQPDESSLKIDFLN